MLETNGRAGEIAKQFAGMGREPPDRIVQAFSVWPWLQRYAKAFDEMSARRNWAVSMAGAIPSAITIAEMKAYAWFLGIRSTTSRRRFLRFVNAQDTLWLEHHAQKTKRGASADNPESTSTDDDDE